MRKPKVKKSDEELMRCPICGKLPENSVEPQSLAAHCYWIHEMDMPKKFATWDEVRSWIHQNIIGVKP